MKKLLLVTLIACSIQICAFDSAENASAEDFMLALENSTSFSRDGSTNASASS